MGYILRINQYGDSEGNYSLVARDFIRVNTTPDQLDLNITQYGIYPVGVFRLNEDLHALPVSTGFVKFRHLEADNNFCSGIIEGGFIQNYFQRQFLSG